jgi:signal transduction histidine kinase
VRRFVVVASLDLALINTLAAVVSFFFRRAIIQHAALATQLEQRVAERTAELDALHQSWQVETAQVAHDLNNFLTVTSAEVSMFLDLLATGADISREKMTAVFERIMDAQHLEAGLISDLHALSVLKANPSALEIEPIPYDLAVRLRSMSNTMRNYTESSKIHLQLNLPEHMIVCADPKRMDRVVLNLITNAIKFTRGYRHGDGEIAVSLNTEGAWAQLEIADNGIGITSAGLTRVGERWVRERREQLPSGTGLGLSFSMAMVHLFGGDIEVSSPGTNQGTTVRVRLPLAPGPSLL